MTIDAGISGAKVFRTLLTMAIEINEFKMLWVDAMTHLAKMIDLKTIWNITHPCGIHNAVCSHGGFPQPELPITRAVYMCHP